MDNEPSIINADEPKVIALIEAARERVCMVAPGVTKAVAQALSRKWMELGPHAVQVILDVDPEVCRLGYGTLEGLTLLRENAANLGSLVCHHPGVRIGLLITDDITLVYSPTPLLVEAGSSQSERPNAIQLGATPSDLLRDVGFGDNGVKDRVIGLDGVESATIKRVEADLKSNPPVKFDLARKVRVFTAKFQFVELEMTGIYISRKKVPIPSGLVGLAGDHDVQSQFHAHFNLVKQAKLEVRVDDDNVLTEKTLHDARQQIIRDFLIPLKGYGMAVLRGNKDQLSVAVNQLRVQVNAFQCGVKQELQKCMDSNITALVNGLLPAVKQKPPNQYTKLYGPEIADDRLRIMLTEDIRKAFGEADSLVEEMKVSLVFKDLTYESLSDPGFLEVAHKAIPGIDALHEEFDAAKEAR